MGVGVGLGVGVGFLVGFGVGFGVGDGDGDGVAVAKGGSLGNSDASASEGGAPEATLLAGAREATEPSVGTATGVEADGLAAGVTVAHAAHKTTVAKTGRRSSFTAEPRFGRVKRENSAAPAPAGVHGARLAHGRDCAVGPSIGRTVKNPPDTLWTHEPDELAPVPDAPPGVDLEPVEETADPRPSGRRKHADKGAAGEPGEDAPHFADWFSSRGSQPVAQAKREAAEAAVTTAEQRKALAD